MTRAQIVYWASTGVFCLVLAFSGFAHFTHQDMMVEGMSKLGYPLHMMTIVGFAKMLGVAALLAPGLPLLKEWAYAGFTINLLGASASHAFVADPPQEILAPLVALAIMTVSYRSRPIDRRLPSSPRTAPVS